MEHSYVDNDFVGTIMKLLTKGNEWYKNRIIWAGDYSEKVLSDNTLYDLAYYDKKDEGIKLFKKINPKPLLTTKEQKKTIIVNHTKKEYLKISDCKKDKDGWIINPLPLLTALGNGNGGGDYHGNNMDYIGLWAFDVISVEFDEKELEGYTKIIPEFKEGEENGSSSENESRAYSNIKKWIRTEKIAKKILVEAI